MSHWIGIDGFGRLGRMGVRLSTCRVRRSTPAELEAEVDPRVQELGGSKRARITIGDTSGCY